MKTSNSDKFFSLKMLLLFSILWLGAINPSVFKPSAIKTEVTTVLVEKFPEGFSVNLIFKKILVK